MKTIRYLAAAVVLGSLIVLTGCASNDAAITANTAKGVGTEAATYARPGFHTEMHDGRLWVFKEGSKELEEFRAQGELAKHVIRPGAGPGGITLKGPDAATLDSYLSTQP
ncbi:MAG: hypothetical protein U5R30_17935 [Deltaproteobacteria bacterium]|nr:hypothetical protein [Deltaproteobacteria bacterium]